MTRKSRAFSLSMLAIGSTLVALTAAQTNDRFTAYWGGQYGAPAPATSIAARSLHAATPAIDRLHHWNQIAIDAAGLDHSPVPAGDPRVFGEQIGPGRSARAMAIVHVAIFDAVNSIAHKYRGFTGIPDVPAAASMDAAIAQAAHDTLVVLYPSQKAHCDELLAAELAAIPPARAKDLGIGTGARAARAILARTANDGANHAEALYGVDFVASDRPGNWRQDPISQIPVALGARWGGVTPLVIASGRAFRVPAPPDMNSAAYTAAYNEVKRLGGDGVSTPTRRTDDQTLAGIYWAYDGTPSLCAPPRLYNQIAIAIADQMNTGVVELARLLALINVSLSDAGIASWESKYYWQVWRPITGIREANRGTGPTGRGDGNPLTIGDPTWSPLGAPASNLTGPNFTPPFPAYPSGHAVFGGALFQILRRFYGTDDIAFTFTSDELNGATVDNQGVVRPLLPRSFRSLSHAEEENGQSRIYLGIHCAASPTTCTRMRSGRAAEAWNPAGPPA